MKVLDPWNCSKQVFLQKVSSSTMWHNTYVWKRHALHIQYNVSYKSTSLTLKSNVFKGLAFMQHDMLKCFLQYAQYCCNMQKCTYGKYVQKSSNITIFEKIHLGTSSLFTHNINSISHQILKNFKNTREMKNNENIQNYWGVYFLISALVVSTHGIWILVTKLGSKYVLLLFFCK